MMQTKEELDKSYETKDPWGYQTNPEDLKRKHYIISTAIMFIDWDGGGEFIRALDVGCGEGWITKDLPAVDIYGYEISDVAASRFPKNVKRATDFTSKYDLILATGVLYPHYDAHTLHAAIQHMATNIVITSHIKGWGALDGGFGTLVFKAEFPYREFVQELKVWRV